MFDTEKKRQPKTDIKYALSLTDEQKAAKAKILESTVVFLVGEAGTSKTFTATSISLDMVFKGLKSKIVITRPTVSTEDIGFLPGTFEEKMEPWLVPIRDNMRKFYNNPTKLKKMEEEGVIEVVSLSHFRGRAQPLDCKVYTPTGYKLMRDINVGDIIICPDNTTSTVINTYPQGIESVYKITFSDNTHTRCSANHLWKVLTKNGFNCEVWTKSKICTTAELLPNLQQAQQKSSYNKFRIPITSPIDFEYKEVYLNPYLFGLLIGDGCISQNGQIGFTTADNELVEYMKLLLPTGASIKHRQGYDYRIVFNGQFSNPLIRYLKEINCFGIKSIDKFIPDIYKYNTSAIRMEVLRGLMDSDGTIFRDGKKFRMSFSTISQRLCDDIQEMVNSLGGITYSRIRKRTPTKLVPNATNDSFEINVKLDNSNPFKLKRKSVLYNPIPVYRSISTIEYVGETETKCIEIDHPDHLYLTDNFIVTHNTFQDAICILDESQNLTSSQLRMAIGRLGKGSIMIFCGDIDQIDLKQPHTSAIHSISKLSNSPHVSVIELTENHRHPAVHDLLELLK